jgi:hypothetical protein
MAKKEYSNETEKGMDGMAGEKDAEGIEGSDKTTVRLIG